MGSFIFSQHKSVLREWYPWESSQQTSLGLCNEKGKSLTSSQMGPNEEKLGFDDYDCVYLICILQWLILNMVKILIIYIYIYLHSILVVSLGPFSSIQYMYYIYIYTYIHIGHDFEIQLPLHHTE